MVSNLRGLVAKEGLVVKDVYPDGNCLFAAVVDQLRVRGEFYFTSRTLRKAAVEHLKQYPFQVSGQFALPYLFGYKTEFPLPKQSKNLDPSHKTDLDFWDCFGRDNPF